MVLLLMVILFVAGVWIGYRINRHRYKDALFAIAIAHTENDRLNHEIGKLHARRFDDGREKCDTESA